VVEVAGRSSGGWVSSGVEESSFCVDRGMVFVARGFEQGRSSWAVRWWRLHRKHGGICPEEKEVDVEGSRSS
jgi:hypothetical protein